MHNNRALEKKNLLWLQSGGCGGCSVSLLGAENPDLLTSLQSAGIELLWHPGLSEKSGCEFLDLLARIKGHEITLDILCLEGAVIEGPGGSGRFHILAGTGTAMMRHIAELAALAANVVAVGSCAAFGGMSAGGDNHIEARGLGFDGREKGGFLGGKFRSASGLPVISVSGCPTHPAWVLETLMHVTSGDMLAGDLDAWGRPRGTANKLVHHGCPRNEFYEFKASAGKLSDMGCLMENLGCKGTQACADCNTRAWNGNGSCISGGFPCIACTEPGFEEPGHAFVETPKFAGIPVGLPIDMPKAWFVALSSLSKAATPRRLKQNAHSDHICVLPAQKRNGGKS